MKLEAAHRLWATSNRTEDLLSFLETLSKEQQDYFFNGLPLGLVSWMQGNFKRRLKTDDVVLGASMGKGEYKRFIIAMTHLRGVFSPTITSGKVHRLTAIEQLPESKIVHFKNDEQFRSLTSWTTRETPLVKARKPIKDLPDIILTYELPSAKNVLFDFGSLHDLCSVIEVGAEEISGNFPGYNFTYWRSATFDVKRFAPEEEVALYLNPSQSIECEWRHV